MIEWVIKIIINYKMHIFAHFWNMTNIFATIALPLYQYLQWKSKFENGRSILRLTGWPGNPSGRGGFLIPLRPDPELCPTRDPPVRVSGTRHWTYYVPIHTPALHIHRPRRTSGLMEVRCFQYHANCWIQLGSFARPARIFEGWLLFRSFLSC